jgi:hypothetical protein
MNRLRAGATSNQQSQEANAKASKPANSQSRRRAPYTSYLSAHRIEYTE